MNANDRNTLYGVYPALITPFTAAGRSIDADALQSLVDHCVAGGVAGLVPVGSTGEFTSLSVQERRRATELTIAAAAGRVPVLPGTGAMTTRETVALSVHAEQCGAAGVLVVPPYYDALSFDDLKTHFMTISASVSIPVMYYNLPGATGVTLTSDQFRDLRETAGVATFKDTGGDFVLATELIERDTGPRLLNGWDTLTFAALAAGVSAVVWGTATILPDQCVRLHQLLIEKHDLVAARSLWSTLWPVCQFLEAHSYPAAVKAACALVGLTTGPCRDPLSPLHSNAVSELANLLESAGADVIR